MSPLVTALALSLASTIAAADPCALTLTASAQVQVDGRATELRFPPTDEDEARELIVIPLPSAAALAGSAIRAAGQDPEVRPEPTLWRVGCAPPHAVERLYSEPGADFTSAALAPARPLLFFTTRTGVAALDLGTRTARQVTNAEEASLPDWDGFRPDRVVRYRADTDVLVVRRDMSPCCHTDRSFLFHVHHPADPARTRLTVPHRVTDLATDAGGTLWLADGDRCWFGGPALVWQSRDQGATWRSTPLGARGAVARLHVAPTRRGHAIAQTDRCFSGDTGFHEGGLAFVTRDNGATWTPLSVRAALATDEEQAALYEDHGDSLQWVRAPDGSLDHLVVKTEWGACFESTDGGATWSPRPACTPGHGPTTELTLGRCRLTATRDGLQTSCGPRRLFPPPP